MIKKWSDPIDKLLLADEKAKNIKNISTVEPTSLDNQNIASNEIIDINPEKIIPWKYKDRPPNELGDIDLLAKKLLEIGQQQPCIVRPHKDKEAYYELIAGERRWRASIKANINLKVVVKDLTDAEASLVQEEENSSTPLSEYARGVSYSRLINDNILKHKDLVEKLGISKQKLSRLLSYLELPLDVRSAISDMSKVSSGTAEKIKQLCNKGEDYKNSIIELADKIRDGKIGHEKLDILVNKKINSNFYKIHDKSYLIRDKFLLKVKESNSGLTIRINNFLINSLRNKSLSEDLLLNKINEALKDVIK
jgi:ParB family chromosome partitioning protein